MSEEVTEEEYNKLEIEVVDDLNGILGVYPEPLRQHAAASIIINSLIQYYIKLGGIEETRAFINEVVDTFLEESPSDETLH